MATVLISFLFSPFFYGVEFFLASTLTTQVALSVATIVVSTATIFYCQRACYQWYENTADFIVRIRNKVGLSDRHVTFTAKGKGGDEKEGTEEDRDVLLDGNNEDEATTTGNKITLGRVESFPSTSKEKSTTKEKPAMPMDSWLQKQTVAMHRSHWVAKPGRIAPTTFIGLGRRGSADNTPTISSGKLPPWALGADPLSEQRTKATLDRRQSSPSSLGAPLSKIVQITSETTGTSAGDKQRFASRPTSRLDEVMLSGTIDASSEATEEAKPPSLSEEVSRDPASIENSSSEDNALAQERLIPTETKVREALLVDGSTATTSLQANIQPLPLDSNSDSDQHSRSQTSEERFSGQTDTDSLATDDIFSDSELDDSKRSDDVFLHDDADPATRKGPLIDIAVESYTRTKGSSEGTQPDIVVCEADTTIRAFENTEAEPDSSVSLIVEGGPIPRKDSFGLLPVLKGRVHHVKIETTSYTGPVTAISIEETKSESDSESAGIIMQEKETDTKQDSGDSDPLNRFDRPAPQKQNSLGVPTVVTGEVSFPGIPPKTSEACSTESRSKIPISKMSKVDSLDVPPVIKFEDRLPPYPTGSTKSKEQLKKSGNFQEVRVRLPQKMSLPRQGRPNSLDIPSLNISESCPPRSYSTDSRTFLLSSLNYLRTTPNSSRGRKQGPSILKRSGSVDRTGPKKSVTFSPMVIPWGGSSEEGIEPSGEGFDLKRHSRSPTSPVRPKVIRYNSVDVPETMRRRQRTEFIRQLGMPAENSDEDQESWEQGRFVRFYRKSNQRDDKQGAKLDGKRSGIDEGPIKTDSIQSTEPHLSPDSSGMMKKSSKERFLEAGGARAVMSVLVTQDSSDRGAISSPSSSEGKYSPPERHGNKDSATSWAKSRFLRSGDGNMKASRLFVERVRGSLDMSESQSDHGSPSDTNEDTGSSSDQQFEETEEGGIRSTSAKSRFLWSCRESTSGSLIPSRSQPADRLFAVWEAVPLILTEVSEAVEVENTKQTNKLESSPALSTSDSHQREVSSKDEIDSPGSSGVHSMEPDETDQERLLSLKENQDSHIKCVPSNLSTSSSGSFSLFSQLKTAIVFDNGSQFMKVGLIDEKKPSIELPNIISRDSVESFNSRYIGLDAVKNCTISPFEYPILGGLIQNWEDVESIWKHIFDAKLGLAPQEHPLLMTEIATVPKQQREKTMEILFETFNIPALYFANQASLSLRATGRTTGLALSSGSGITEVVPVYNGVTLSRAVTKLDLGGRSATKYLAHLIEKDTGHRLMTSPGAMEVLRELKEDQTDVNNVPDIAKSPTSDAYDDSPWHCWLPDGSTVEVKRDLVQTCAEPLFQPALAGILHQPGMPNLVADCLDRCDQNMLSEFPSSLLLCGGNTYLGGFTGRLQSELNTLGLGYITVDAPKGRDLLPWIGGALLASQLDNENSWLTLDEYVEHGASLVHKRCT